MIVKTEDRVSYLDGLRGLASLVVLFGHLVIALLPSVITLSPGTMHTRFDVAFGMLPIGFIWNGSSAVCIFFLLSGYVLTNLTQKSELSLAAHMGRRYVRLMLPMLISATIPLFLMAVGLVPNLAASKVTASEWLGSWYQFPPSLLSAIWEMVYGAFGAGKSVYNSNLWTMRIELLGSLYVFIVTLTSRDRRVRLGSYIASFAFVPSEYYPLFAVGAICYDFRDVTARIFTSGSVTRLLPPGMCAVGLFLCSMPSTNNYGVLPWHSWIPVFVNDGLNSLIWHEIGACMVMLGVMHTEGIKRYLSSSLPQWLGRISFTLYLVHLPLLCSLTAYLVLFFSGKNYYVLVFVVGGLSLAVILTISTLLTHVMDTMPTLLSRRVGRAIDFIAARDNRKNMPRC